MPIRTIITADAQVKCAKDGLHTGCDKHHFFRSAQLHLEVRAEHDHAQAANRTTSHCSDEPIGFRRAHGIALLAETFPSEVLERHKFPLAQDRKLTHHPVSPLSRR
jgi:hypothetical protein